MKKFEITSIQKHSAVIEAVDSEQAILEYGYQFDGCSVESLTETEVRELSELHPNPVIEEINNALSHMEIAFDYLGMAIVEEVGENGTWERSDLDYPRCELQDLFQRIQKIRDKQ